MTGVVKRIDTETSADEQALRRVAFHAMLNGEAVDRAELVAITGLAPEKIDVLLNGLVERGLIVVEPDSGRVVGSWGLSLVPTNHRLHIQGRELHTWCALDAVGIPAGLDEDASVASRCHQCGVPVSVEMTKGQMTCSEPADVQVWMMADQVGRSVVGFT